MSNNDDELISNIFGNTSFLKEPDNNFKHKRQHQFKSLGAPSHEKRIEYHLDRQKEKRRSLLDQVRSLVSLPTTPQKPSSSTSSTTTTTTSDNNNEDINIEEVEENEDEDDKEITTVTEEGDDGMKLGEEEQDESTYIKRGISRSQKKKKKSLNRKEKKRIQEVKMFSNHLMMAESMVDVPRGLQEEWYAVPVPNGQRCLVISHSDNTIARAPDGNILKKFPSSLPFGSVEISRREQSSGGRLSERYCVLDCLFESQSGVFYVLDILCWKGYMLYDCDTEFRFFWRMAKLSETTVSTITSYNPFPFKPVPYYNCNDLSTVSTLISSNSLDTQQKDDALPYQTEFLLFYHKESHYEFGSTPLFCSISRFCSTTSTSTTSTKEIPLKQKLTKEQREILERIIRVDHAGEFGAARIYEGQLAILANTKEGPLIREMANQEIEHQNKFNQLIYEKRVRPTVLSPIWNVAGFGLGYVSALMGKEAAMAVTVAVETVIGEHYNDQLRQLNDLKIDDPDLKETIRKFRDDELEHMHIGIDHDAELAPLYRPFSELVKAATKTAIFLSTRI
eukprot:gene9937-12185_t